MGIKIHNVLDGEGKCNFQWGGDTVHLTYDPNEWTPASESRWKELSGQGWVGPFAADFVVKLVKEWDVFGDWDDEEQKFVEGTKMFPLVKSKVQHLPLPFLEQVIDSVTGDIRPKAGRKPSSDDS